MSNTNLVNETRQYLRRLARRRSSGLVTADDAQNFLSNRGFRGSQNERLSVVRSVLSEPEFVPVGTTRSSRPAARSRTITAWTA